MSGPGPFAFPDYRRSFAARAISSAGTYMQLVASSWYAYMSTGSAVTSGVLALLTLGPTLVGGPLGGALLDRHDPIRLAITLSLAQAVPPALLAAWAGTGHLSLGMLYVLTFAGAVPNSLSAPVMSLVMAGTVPKDVRQSAVARTSVIFNASRLIGAVGGGFLVHLTGLAPAYGLNAVSYVLVAMVISRITLSYGATSAPATGENSGRFSSIWAMPTIRLAAFGMVTFFLLVAPIEHLMPVVAKEHGVAASSVGILVGGLPLGALLASRISGRGRTATSRLVMTAVGLIAAGIGMAELALTPHHGIAIDILGTMLIGCGWEFVFVGTQAMVLVDVPAPFRGRSMGLFYSVVYGATAVGALALGHVIDRRGMPATLLSSVSLAALAAVAILTAGVAAARK